MSLEPCYSSFDDFNRKISCLKLSSSSVENNQTFTRIFRFDNTHSIPFIIIFVKQTFEFIIRVFSWKMPESHNLHNYILEDFTLSTLIDAIEKLNLCPGVSSTSPTLDFDPFFLPQGNLSETVFYRTQFCELLVVLVDTPCNSCQKGSGKVKKANGFWSEQQKYLVKPNAKGYTISYYNH